MMISLIFNPQNRAIESILTDKFQSMIVARASSKEARSGLHASSLLVPESEWCVRKYTLDAVMPDGKEQAELQSWDWKREAIFEHGWLIHRKWQKWFRDSGMAVWNENLQGWETDLTHYDEERQVHFSPDAVIHYGPYRFAVEIKGINQDAYLELGPTLETAMKESDVVRKAVPQLNLYLHMLELQYGIILVENKNNQEFRLFFMQYNREMVQPYLDRMYSVKGNVGSVKEFGLSRLKKRVCKSKDVPLARRCPFVKCCFELEG